VPHHIFVSQPTTLTRPQKLFCGQLERTFQASGLTTHTVGVSDFTSRLPLRKILDTITTCDGACVLGLIQVAAPSAVFKPNTIERRIVPNAVFATPWNQIEAGMAVARGLPLLVVCESGVAGGIFDQGVGDAFTHVLPAKGKLSWLQSEQFQQSMAEWIGLMDERLPSRRP
jgi:hypothetical protein